ncbi:porin [Rhizomicrobium palustre]|uniref:Porin n=1 Tax=Rhizomicrobium palustre TaxID=189966 RepID=A0A846MXI2_9PROT|nr:carbohydrate porin [Rhizomicrobium palustre]NIK87949.1 porin [Rhizomicrobium palustre]
MKAFLQGSFCAVLLAPAAFAADPFTPHLTYNTALISNLSGGTKAGTVGVGSAHLQLLADGGALFGADGLTAFADGLFTHGGAPDALIGDAQGVSNIAAPPGAKLYEAWVQYAHGRFSVLAGRYDLNSEFYRLSSAQLFLNSSFGIGPEYAQSGVAGPSIYPDTSLALRLTYKPADNMVLRAAVIDDRPPEQSGPDGPLLIGEFAWLQRPSASMPPGESHNRVGRNAGLPAYDNKLALGGWYDTKGSPDQSTPGVNRHAAGAYFILDHLLWSGDSSKLAGFLQTGVADGRAGRFGFYLGAGLNAVGLIPGRPNDEIGLAFARAESGAHFRTLQQSLPGLASRDAELSFETTYLAQINDWFALQPDLQWVQNPGTAKGHALVFQLEAELSF